MLSSKQSVPCRLLLEGAGSPERQMAVDEVLLLSAAERGCCTLRFYQWSVPTLSLGYFQSFAERAAHAASRHCPLVRRQTGGGAIVHDRELTYSLALECAHPLAADATRLYNAVHAALVRVLGEFDLRASCRDVDDTPKSGSPPFLCFLRQAVGDVMLGQSKICGSAQRRRQGAILQHGSLLLARSVCAAELPGILELGGRLLEAGDLANRWGREIAANLGLSLIAAELSPEEQEAAARLASEKYATPLWNRRR